MNAAIFAALAATVGFAGGDVCAALLVRKVSGRASILLVTVLKLLVYLPFAALLWREFTVVDAQSVAWMLLLGVLFFIAYWGFYMAFEVGKNPALIGVVAGCFPASAAFVAIVFLGQRPTPATIALLITVLCGVVLIGLPRDLRKSLRMDKGILLALLAALCWGTFGALLHEPVNRLGTPHAWFVVQTGVALVMVLGVGMLYNRQTPGIMQDTRRNRAWRWVLAAGLIGAASEALQAFSLGSGRQIVIIEALLGCYPAAYFLMAHKIFKEPLYRRQWVGIVVIAIAIVLLSAGSTSI